MGGIPFSAGVDEIKQYMAAVGPVLDFRLKTEPGTGRSKGYGFCTYADAATAQAAIRQRLSPPLHSFVLGVVAAAFDKQEEKQQQRRTQ